MAKGQLHSTGTICKAEIRCPIEAEGGQHFDSVEQLIDHTAAETGAEAAEIRSVIASGVGPAEAVSMAKEGFLGRSMPQSLSREPKTPAPLKPSQVKELDQFDPAVHSVFSNATARKEPSIAAKALKREVANGEWMEELSERHREEVAAGEERPLYGDSETKMIQSRARQAAMAREMHWLAENDPSYKAKLPAGVSALLRTVQGNSHSGVPIGLVKKAA